MSTLLSTAIPIVSTMPMMPGKVSVALSSDRMPKIIPTLTATAMLAKTPNNPYVTTMKTTTSAAPK